MRNKAERRIRHVTTLKVRAGSAKTTNINREELHKAGGKTYKKTTVGGQDFYVKLSTQKD